MSWNAALSLVPAGARSLRRRLSDLFERLVTEERRDQARRITVGLAFAGLFVHLALVALARHLPDPPAVVSAVGTNYLAALYTPFSFVLFYEVLLLILSIPESTTRSLGRQFEILSLIVIRNVFKDVAEFQSVTDFEHQMKQFGSVLLDMGGGLVMFLLVVLFYAVNRRRPAAPSPDAEDRRRLDVFVQRKRIISLFLSVLLFALALTSLGTWAWSVAGLAGGGPVPSLDVKTIFYVDLFTVMIFTDAVILLSSLMLQDRYALVFRNAAFVVARILLLFSLAVPKPWNVALGVASIGFGVLVLLIYHLALRRHPESIEPAEA